MKILLFGILGFFAVFVLVTIANRVSVRRLRKKRLAERSDDFVQYFVDRGSSEIITLSIQRFLRDWMGHKDFPVRSDDKISDLYGIVEGDLDDMIVEIAEENSITLPSDKDFWEQPVETVEDLILIFDSISLNEAESGTDEL